MSSDGAVKESDEALLASLGYKQEFKRAFKPLEVFGIAFSIIGLLPSIASVLSSSISNGGAASMVWGWAVGSCFIVCIGMALAELASFAPTSGGMYYLTYTLSSPRCRNLLCWTVGYASTVGAIAGIASTDWGCTVQIAAAVNIASNGQLIITNSQSYGIYAAIILSQAVVCSLGTKALARLQIVYIVFNVLLCLVVIIALPIATPNELMNPPSYVFGNFTNLSGWPDIFTFILGLLAPLWTISGYDAVIDISEESSNAATAGPWGMVIAIGIASVLGWVINVSLAFCMGPNLSDVLGSTVDQPMAQIFLGSFGRSRTLVLWSFVILVQYMMGSSLVLAGSRSAFAFARDGALPLSNVLYRINAYTGTPVNTVWFDCAFALLVGLLALLGPGAISAVFTLEVTATYIEIITTIVSRFIFANAFKPGPFSLGIWGAPVAAVAVSFMLFMLVILCFPATPHPHVESMNYTSVVLGGVMGLATAWYYCPTYGGVHWFRGPTVNLELELDDPADVGGMPSLTQTASSVEESEGDGSMEKKTEDGLV